MYKKNKFFPLFLVLLLLLLMLLPVSAFAKSATRLNKTRATVTVGSTCQISLLDNSKTVKWSVSSTSKASLKKVSNNSVVLTAKKAGTVTVKAKAGSKTYSCKVTIKQKSPALSARSVSIYTGQAYTLKLLNNSASVKWSTSSKSKAPIKVLSKNSVKVTGKKAGTVTITAKAGGKKYTCKIKIYDYVKAKSVSVSVKGDLTEGKTAQAYGTIVPSNTTNKSVTWSSSDRGIAEVSAKGILTLKKAGTVTITCRTADGVSGRTRITVKQKPSLQPPQTEAPETEPPKQTEEQETELPEQTEEPETEPPKQTEAPETEPPKQTEAPEIGSDEDEETETEKLTESGTEADKPTEDETETVIIEKGRIEVTDFPEASLKAGDTFQLNASAQDGSPLSWESSDPGVAAVSRDGTVSCVGKGTVTVSCRSANGRSGAEITFSVKAAGKTSSKWKEYHAIQ